MTWLLGSATLVVLTLVGSAKGGFSEVEGDGDRAVQVSLFDAVKSAQALEKLLEGQYGERAAGAREAVLLRLRVTIEDLDEPGTTPTTPVATMPHRKGA